MKNEKHVQNKFQFFSKAKNLDFWSSDFNNDFTPFLVSWGNPPPLPPLKF